jgi:hypothetical protein
MPPCSPGTFPAREPPSLGPSSWTCRKGDSDHFCAPFPRTSQFASSDRWSAAVGSSTDSRRSDQTWSPGSDLTCPDLITHARFHPPGPVPSGLSDSDAPGALPRVSPAAFRGLSQSFCSPSPRAMRDASHALARVLAATPAVAASPTPPLRVSVSRLAAAACLLPASPPGKAPPPPLPPSGGTPRLPPPGGGRGPSHLAALLQAVVRSLGIELNHSHTPSPSYPRGGIDTDPPTLFAKGLPATWDSFRAASRSGGFLVFPSHFPYHRAQSSKVECVNCCVVCMFVCGCLCVHVRVRVSVCVSVCARDGSACAVRASLSP